MVVKTNSARLQEVRSGVEATVLFDQKSSLHPLLSFTLIAVCVYASQVKERANKVLID